MDSLHVGAICCLSGLVLILASASISFYVFDDNTRSYFKHKHRALLQYFITLIKLMIPYATKLKNDNRQLHSHRPCFAEITLRATKRRR